VIPVGGVNLAAEDPIGIGGVDQDHRNQNNGTNQCKPQAFIRGSSLDDGQGGRHDIGIKADPDPVVIGADPATDVALLSIKADVDLPFVKFGTSETMRVGDEVVAVGNPFGLSSTVTSGIISAKSRDIHSGPYDEFIQTDAAINRGNSGGPLFNNAGDVIGMNTAIISPGGGSVGIGFAVPSDVVREVVADLKDDGTVTRGWLGVSIRPMSDEVAEVLGYDSATSAVVDMVAADSPAATAGLEKGDIILDFDGTTITDLRDLTRAVAAKNPDDAATISILRRGKEVTLDVTIGLLAQQKA